MNATKPNRRRIATIALSCLLALAALVVFPRAASAAQPVDAAQGIRAGVERLPIQDLEDVFWLCDHTATTRGVHAAPLEVCSAVYEALRDQKFGGDLGELLAWWNENKQSRHGVLASALP
jgi:hypothetical protein